MSEEVHSDTPEIGVIDRIAHLCDYVWGGGCLKPEEIAAYDTELDPTGWYRRFVEQLNVLNNLYVQWQAFVYRASEKIEGLSLPKGEAEKFKPHGESFSLTRLVTWPDPDSGPQMKWVKLITNPAVMFDDKGEPLFPLFSTPDEYVRIDPAPPEGCPWFLLEIDPAAQVRHRSDKIPHRDGLPDLRIFDLPPCRWDELSQAQENVKKNPEREEKKGTDQPDPIKAGKRAFDMEPADQPHPHPVKLGLLARAPNDRFHQAVYLGLSRKEAPGSWKINPHEGGMVYDAWDTHGCSVLYRPQEVFQQWCDELQDEILIALDDRFRDMRGTLVADVIDILFIHWMNSGRPPKALVTLSQILKYRKVSNQEKNQVLHWKAIRDARSIRLQTTKIDAALLEIDAARAPQLSLWCGEANPRDQADVVYAYSPGAFLSLSLDETTYLADYTTKILELDPYRADKAKALARYLRSEWRMNPEGYIPGFPEYPRYRTIEAHLRDAGITPESIYPKIPSRFIKTVEEEFERLWVFHALGDSDQKLFSPEALYHPEDRQPEGKRRFKSHEDHRFRRVHLPPPKELLPALKDLAKKRYGRKSQKAALKREAEIRSLAKGNGHN